MPHARPTFKRKLRDAFTERLLLKFAALFFALVLWLVVSAEEPTEEVLGVRFEPALDSGVVISGDMPNVRALVLGRGSDRRRARRPSARRHAQAPSRRAPRVVRHDGGRRSNGERRQRRSG